MLSERSSFRQSVRNVTHALRLRGPLAADTTAQTLHGLNLFLIVWLIFGHFVVAVYPMTKFRIGLFALGGERLRRGVDSTSLWIAPTSQPGVPSQHLVVHHCDSSHSTPESTARC